MLNSKINKTSTEPVRLFIGTSDTHDRTIEKIYLYSIDGF